MKLAVSNIAWLPADTPDRYAQLAAAGVEGIEAAPGVLFPEAERPLRPRSTAIAAARAAAAVHGLRFASLQSVHFGLSEAQLFGPPPARAIFIDALTDAVDLAAALGMAAIVIGSPRARIRPEGMSETAAFDSAAEGLRPVAERAAQAGVRLAFEANPALYGGNFVTHFADALRLCQQVDHPGFGINLDLGERLANDGAIDLDEAARWLAHVQVSAPELAPPLGQAAAVGELAAKLRGVRYDGWVSLEMRRPAIDAGAVLLAAVKEVAAALKGGC